MDFLGSKIDDAKRIIKSAGSGVVLAGFTGGSDSLVLVHLLSELKIPFRPFFCNTGIGVFEQWEFIRQYCKDNQWDLIEQNVVYRTYKQMVLLNGFPGPAMHRIMYQNLKEKSIVFINNQHNKKALILTGVRLSESERRKINITDEVQTNNKLGITWVSPIMNWDDDDKNEYLEERKIKKSTVSECLGLSGECLCGAYAKKGELQKLKEFYPATYKVIADLEETLFKIGYTWGWEDKPPGEKETNNVMEKIFPGFKEIKKTKREIKELSEGKPNLFMPMCQRCEFAE